MSNFFDELEAQIHAAARAQVADRPAGARSGLRRLRKAASVVSTVAAVAVTVAIAAIALTQLRQNPKGSTATVEVPGRQQLIDILAVLRRPQTKADLAFPQFLVGHRQAPLPQGTPDLPLVRYATTTPWGERFFFVLMRPPTAAAVAVLERQRPWLPRRLIANLVKRGETLGLYSNAGGSRAGTAANIEGGTGPEIEGAGREFAGGSTQTRFILVVPDGVAKVEFVLPRQPQRAVYGAPVYKHVLAVTVPVHDNIAAVQVDRQCCGGNLAMIWYAANGGVIKRIGNFAALNQVSPPAKPAPETALSLAAERDPSTPNPVWVTPSAGSPRTAFTIHFRVLLNGADYGYTVTGTRCPKFTFPGGTGKPNALRGSLWSDSLSAVQRQRLCPGVYHVAVTVMDFGRTGNLGTLTRPFGSATFNVR